MTRDPEPPAGPSDPADDWAAFVDGLVTAGERTADATAELSAVERADAYRALVRALNNQLGRFEVDRERPELVPFNGWRQKFLMDNPDFRYWVADIRDDRRYRVVGNIGGAAYLSITAYAAGGIADAEATSRIDSDELEISADGYFELTVARDRPSAGAWLALPAGATALWVRQFRNAPDADEGWCAIEPLDDPPAAPSIEPDRFGRHLRRAGTVMATVPKIVANSTAPELAAPNTVRHWSEMTGGAAFTEPSIHYLRGAWELADDEALVVEGSLVPCRFWNVLLYSRFLNSLDHRHRTVSRTAASSTVTDGRYRFVLAADDPGVGDWLDTEGRPFGVFVLRFLQPETTPELPTLRVVRANELDRLDRRGTR